METSRTLSASLGGTVVVVALISLSACGGDDDSQASQFPECRTGMHHVVRQDDRWSDAVGRSGCSERRGPTYCKVNGTLAPKLNFEIRLPETRGMASSTMPVAADTTGRFLLWNRRSMRCARAMPRLQSDSGHQGSGVDASFALTDTFAAQLFGSLSIPTVMSTAHRNGRRPPTGNCHPSPTTKGARTAGGKALMNVQRYPNLFDGVIARAPAYNWVGFMGAFNRTAKALAAPGGSFSPAKTALLAKSVRDACDGLDGIVDGVVSNQAACTPTVFDPASLRCPGGADTGDTCLSDVSWRW